MRNYIFSGVIAGLLLLMLVAFLGREYLEPLVEQRRVPLAIGLWALTMGFVIAVWRKGG